MLTSLQQYPLSAAWGAAVLVLASFALYSCFDLLGRRYTGHTLGIAAVMTTTFVSYALNLNLGTMVGGVALRYRLYSRMGLAPGVIARVMSVSMLANWMGYLLLGGVVFTLLPPDLPADWSIGTAQLRIVGCILLAMALGYLGACAFSRQRSLTLRGHVIELPSLRLASLQVLMGAANWLLMASILFILLQHRIAYTAVVGTLLVAAISGVIARIPGGLGILEAVFVAVLSHQMPEYELLASLVAYRVIYYLVPLGIALVVYLVMEAHAKKLARAARQGGGGSPAAQTRAPRA